MLSIAQIFLIVLLSLTLVSVALYIASLYKFSKRTALILKLITGILFCTLVILAFATGEKFTPFNIVLFVGILVGGLWPMILAILKMINKEKFVKLVSLLCLLVCTSLFFVAFILLYKYEDVMLILAVGLLGVLVVMNKAFKLDFGKLFIPTYIFSFMLTFALSQCIWTFINLGEIIVNYIPMLIGMVLFVGASILLKIDYFKQNASKILKSIYIGVFYGAGLLLTITLFLSL